jgi:hypothetical protein
MDAHMAGALRVLARDDLLQVAYDAEEAVGIVQQNDRLSHVAFTEPELFGLALERHLEDAEDSANWAIRGQHLAYAAAIVRFCGLVDIRVPAGCDSVDLYGRAIKELSAVDQQSRSILPDHQDFTLGVITTYRAIRDLRLAGKPKDAFLLAWRPDHYFHGSGAEPHRGHFQFEIAACELALSEPARAAAALGEFEKYWASSRASAWPTRNRYEFARALSAFAEGDADATQSHLEAALTHLRKTRGTETQHDVQELSLTLALTEYLTVREIHEEINQRTLELIDRAVSLVEQIRGRWRVVARSHGPLSLVFQRIYGDIALLVSRLSGREAAKLGLRVSMSAKQTGFASLMRANRSLMNDRLSTLLDEIVIREDQLEYTSFTSDDEWSRLHEDLGRLRSELEDIFSPLLADFVLPEPTHVETVLEVVSTRYVLDFVALPETASRAITWFRTMIHPGGSIEFGRLEPKNSFQTFFYGDDGHPALVSRLQAVTAEHEIWCEFARDLLPTSLLVELGTRDLNDPIDLLISPHSDLCFVPWPALNIDCSKTRLIERAVITQTPALTCLSNAEAPRAHGPALVRLVAEPQPGGVNVERECTAWGLRIDEHGDVPLSRCDFRPDHSNAEVAGRLVSVLEDEPGRYGFVHVAAHGRGLGLYQEIKLPERLTAGHAFGVPWPPSVLLAACDVGKVSNIREAEPFGFPVALLAGGAQCVVAGILAVSDQGTGMIAAAMVNSLCAGARLDVALRDAQCKLLNQGWNVYDWALLSAFVR